MLERDGAVGVCSVCGPVDLLFDSAHPKGRCGNANRERNRGKQRQRSTFHDGTRKPTLEQQAAMLSDQDGKCAICDVTFNGTPYIDHCHESKLVRGLLCRNCNLGLGLFGDDVDKLRRAIEYVSKSRV